MVVRVTGNPALNHEEMLGLAWDIVVGGVFCFLFVVFVLYLALRSLRLVAAAVATLLVGLVWTAAFATAAVGHLNLISLAFGVLFIGLGVDFTIHLGMSYAALRRDGLDHPSAALAAVDSVGSSLVLCTLTTSIGFYVFVPTDYLGVAELGLISGTGMLIILFLTVTFFPALLTSVLRLPEGEVPRADLRFRGDAAQAITRHAGAVRWIALAAGIGALCLLPYTSFDPNVVQMRNPSTESVQAFNDLAATNERGSPWYANALASDLAAARELAARLGDLDLVSDAFTLADYVPEDQEEKREILADLSLIIDTPASKRASEAGLSEEEQLSALRELRDFLAASGVGHGDSKLQASVGRLEDVLDEFLARVDSEGDVAAALESLEETLLGQLPVHMDRLRERPGPGSHRHRESAPIGREADDRPGRPGSRDRLPEREPSGGRRGADPLRRCGPLRGAGCDRPGGQHGGVRSRHGAVSAAGARLRDPRHRPVAVAALAPRRRDVAGSHATAAGCGAHRCIDGGARHFLQLRQCHRDSAAAGNRCR